MKKIIPVLASGVVMAFIAVMTFAFPASAEILNNDEYGSMEIIDISVIDRDTGQAIDRGAPYGVLKPSQLCRDLNREACRNPGVRIDKAHHKDRDKVNRCSVRSGSSWIPPNVDLTTHTRRTGQSLRFTIVDHHLLFTTHYLLLTVPPPITDYRLPITGSTTASQSG